MRLYEHMAGPLPEAPAVERQLARDIVLRRALPALPVLVALGLLWGVDGAASAAFGAGLAIANLLVGAALITWAARVSPTALMAAVLGGYLARMAVIGVVLFLVSDAAWVEPVPLFASLLVTHLGSLLWETRSVSASLAYPGLKPRPAREDRPT